MKTAKALGFKKGDLVVTGIGFPAVISQHVNTATPFCEVFGLEHELGSVYAHELQKINEATFWMLVENYRHLDKKPYTKEAREVWKRKP